jgi:hypothetical protein
MHIYHTEGRFALRPIKIANDGTKMDLEFHWFKPATRGRKDRLHIMELPESSRNLIHGGDENVHSRYDPETPMLVHLLTSGGRFTISVPFISSIS